MRCVLLADTHDNLLALRGLVPILQDLSVDLILHAGDYVSPFSLLPFKEEGLVVHGVFGNNDGEKVGLMTLFQENGWKLGPSPQIYTVGDQRFLLAHEPFFLNRSFPPWEGVAVYGHTHRYQIEKIGPTLVINPGEASGWLTGRRTAVFFDTDTGNHHLLEW